MPLISLSLLGKGGSARGSRHPRSRVSLFTLFTLRQPPGQREQNGGAILHPKNDIYWRRIQRLALRPRSMTLRAAGIVVDAAMYGIGCTEGTARIKIQAAIDAEVKQIGEDLINGFNELETNPYNGVNNHEQATGV